jgi:heme oxygenase
LPSSSDAVSDDAGPIAWSPSSPRRIALQRGTAEAHAALERMMESAGCFASRRGYLAYLRAVQPLYAALEAALEEGGAARWLPDWPERRKAGLIALELEEFRGVAADETEGMAQIGASWRGGSMLGVLYVLEGATLGGAVLARRMARHGIAPRPRVSLLDPYGPMRGAMWRRFLQALDAARMTAAEDAALVPAARATFGLFADRLREAA